MKSVPIALPIELRWDPRATHCVTYYYDRVALPNDDLALLLADKAERDALARVMRFEVEHDMTKKLDTGVRPNPALIPGYQSRGKPSLKRKGAPATLIVVGAPLPREEADSRGCLRVVDVAI